MGISAYFDDYVEKNCKFYRRPGSAESGADIDVPALLCYFNRMHKAQESDPCNDCSSKRSSGEAAQRVSDKIGIFTNNTIDKKMFYSERNDERNELLIKKNESLYSHRRGSCCDSEDSIDGEDGVCHLLSARYKFLPEEVLPSEVPEKCYMI